MPKKTASLIAGRNTAPLSPSDIRRATNTLTGFADKELVVRHEAGAKTVFRVGIDEESGAEFGEIVFGPDIYPGRNTVDANSTLSMEAAAAHEVAHYHRWKNKLALPEDEFEHLDEALTSLEAIQRFGDRMDGTDRRQLAADAVRRINLYLASRHENNPETV